jgi:hypothetical protein
MHNKANVVLLLFVFLRIFPYVLSYNILSVFALPTSM